MESTIEIGSDKINFATYKLLRIIGCPPWFQSSGMKKLEDGTPYLFITVNTKSCKDELERVPDNIDGIKVRIFYKNIMKHYYSSKAVPRRVRIQSGIDI